MRTLGHLLRAVLLGALISVAALAADEARKHYDIPAGDAAAALKQFSATSGHETLFAAEAVRGVKTPAVRGELTAREAVDALLTGTGLTALQDEKTGAIAVRRNPRPNDSRVAQISSGRPEQNTKIEKGVVVLEAVQVTGSRIRGLLEGAAAQPVLTLDSKDIERTGAMSLGDLFRYIPQVSSFSTGQAVTRTAGTNVQAAGSAPVFVPNYTGVNTSAASRTSATLRGSPTDGTLLLVDGRRVPKNNQSAGGDSYDLNGIPLAAIDRIEVLLDGASSLYGADAIGGVINVILKKSYRGDEVRLGYENTFDKDAGVFTASFTHGFAQGKLHGLATVSFETANSMAMRDRALTASYDRRAYGGQDLRGTVIGGAGRVSRTGSVPLPGLTTTSAAVPSGTSGTNLTQADYAAAGAIPAAGDLAQYQDFNSAYTRRNALVNLRYDFRTWLELYTEVRAAENRSRQAPQPISATVSIPASYPGNPFGIAVTLSKYFFDVQPPRISTDDTFSSTVGARGKLPRDWRYDASLSYLRGHTRSDSASGPSIVTALFNAAVAAGQTPNLFYDSTKVANPNAPGVLEALTTPVFEEEVTESWIYSAQIDGPVYTLPAGKVAMAAGAEYREEYTDFPKRLTTDTTSALAANRDVSALFGEVNVPLAAPAQRIAFLNQFNVSGSFRRERYSDGGSSSNPRGGLAWRPVKWLLLRGSYGEGFKVPNMQQTGAPIRTGTQRFSLNVDPLRGNELQNVNFVTTTSGGNPGLRPERSKNTTAGLVLAVPQIKGLSFSLDYFDNKFEDRIGSVTFEQRALYFPERVTRGPNLPTDQPGWAGPITGVDLRVVNVAYSRTTGYDLSAKFDRTLSWGDVLVNVTGTKYTRNDFVPAPQANAISTTNTDSLPVQISGSAFLNRGAWGTGALATYRASNRASTLVTATPSALRWDWQFSYDFGKAAWAKSRATWYGRALKGIKASLTVFDVFNTEPPLDNLYMPDNTVLDARLRRYALSFRKTF